MRNKIARTIIIGLVSMLIIVACSQAQPTPTPTPTPTPVEPTGLTKTPEWLRGAWDASSRENPTQQELEVGANFFIISQTSIKMGNDATGKFDLWTSTEENGCVLKSSSDTECILEVAVDGSADKTIYTFTKTGDNTVSYISELVIDGSSSKLASMNMWKSGSYGFLSGHDWVCDNNGENLFLKDTTKNTHEVFCNWSGTTINGYIEEISVNGVKLHLSNYQYYNSTLGKMVDGSEGFKNRYCDKDDSFWITTPDTEKLTEEMPHDIRISGFWMDNLKFTADE